MNRCPTPSRLHRAVFFILAVASSLVTLGSVGGLVQHYANGGPSAPGNGADDAGRAGALAAPAHRSQRFKCAATVLAMEDP